MEWGSVGETVELPGSHWKSAYDETEPDRESDEFRYMTFASDIVRTDVHTRDMEGHEMLQTKVQVMLQRLIAIASRHVECV